MLINSTAQKQSAMQHSSRVPLPLPRRRWEWLREPRDQQGRPPSDPDHDPTTLLIPPAAWGTDLRLDGGSWSIARSRGFKKGGPKPRDPLQLRKNAYRVLLTRGRSATVVFVPPMPELDETYAYLAASGCVEV